MTPAAAAAVYIVRADCRLRAHGDGFSSSGNIVVIGPGVCSVRASSPVIVRSYVRFLRDCFYTDSCASAFCSARSRFFLSIIFLNDPNYVVVVSQDGLAFNFVHNGYDNQAYTCWGYSWK